MAHVLTRDNILDKAKSIINGEREGTYGSPEDSFKIISKLWSAYLDKPLSSADVANLMILMKVARNANGVFKDDNWIDICGYAAIGGEIQGVGDSETVTLTNSNGDRFILTNNKNDNFVKEND